MTRVGCGSLTRMPKSSAPSKPASKSGCFSEAVLVIGATGAEMVSPSLRSSEP